MGKSKYKAEFAEELGGGSEDISKQGRLEDPENYDFFWEDGSPFSQWHKAKYTCDGFEYNFAEQGMMHSKALLFEDEAAAQAISEATSPSKQKALGRLVQIHHKTWRKQRQQIVEEQNMAKFGRNQCRGLRPCQHRRVLVKATK